MGPSRPRNSTRARKARSAKSVPESRRKPAPKPFKVRNGRRRQWRPGPRATATRVTQRKPADPIPVATAIELVIHQERGTLTTVMTLLFSLHCILRRQLEDDTDEVDEVVKDAAKWADVTELTSMSLVKVHTVLRNLDAIALGRTPDVDPEDVEITESVAELPHGQGSNS